jgi:hypothetical protein
LHFDAQIIESSGKFIEINLIGAVFAIKSELFCKFEESKSSIFEDFFLKKHERVLGTVACVLNSCGFGVVFGGGILSS